MKYERNYTKCSSFWVHIAKFRQLIFFSKKCIKITKKNHNLESYRISARPQASASRPGIPSPAIVADVRPLYNPIDNYRLKCTRGPCRLEILLVKKNCGDRTSHYEQQGCVMAYIESELRYSVRFRFNCSKKWLRVQVWKFGRENVEFGFIAFIPITRKLQGNVITPLTHTLLFL